MSPAQQPSEICYRKPILLPSIVDTGDDPHCLPSRLGDGRRLRRTSLIAPNSP
jgi:hypothetical protein